MNKKVERLIEKYSTAEAITQLWEVVSKLKSTEELSGSSVIKPPPAWTFSRPRTNALKGLHRQGFIKVERRLSEKDILLDPHTLQPTVQLVTNILENDTILNDSATYITLKKDFGPLYSALKTLMEKGTQTEVSTGTKSPLPGNCYWEETTFHCGAKEVDFHNTKHGKYFRLLTNDLGLPVYNQDVYKDLEYILPRQVANGVKKDLAARLDQKGLLKTNSRPNGRIAITSVSEEPNPKSRRGGYVCRIT